MTRHAQWVRAVAGSSLAGLLLASVVFVVLARRAPVGALAAALREADYAVFLAAIAASSALTVAGDSFVVAVGLGWFHRSVGYVDLLAIRAASQVVGLFSVNAGHAALVAAISRRFQLPLLELGGTIGVLLLSHYLEMVLWSSVGLIRSGALWPAAVLGIGAAAVCAGGAAGTYVRRRAALTAAPPMRGTSLAAVRRIAATVADWRVWSSLKLASPRCYATLVLLRAPLFFCSLCLYYVAAEAFHLHIPFVAMLTFLPVIFMVAALPVVVARLATAQAAWVVLFGTYDDAARLLAFALASQMTVVATQGVIGLIFLPRAYRELVLVPPLGSAERRTEAAASTSG